MISSQCLFPSNFLHCAPTIPFDSFAEKDWVLDTKTSKFGLNSTFSRQGDGLNSTFSRLLHFWVLRVLKMLNSSQKSYFSFFAHFKIWGRSNCCTNRFVLKNCTSDRKMKKIKRYSFWVFSKKPETLCKKGLKTLKMLNSRPKSWIQHFQGSPAARQTL